MSQSLDDQNERVLRLIKLLCIDEGIPIHKIELGASLYHDLDIAGLDGWNLMDRIREEFDIDMTSKDYESYFGDELPFNPFFSVWRWVSGRNPTQAVPRLEVQDLLRVIATKRWEVVQPRPGSP